MAIIRILQAMALVAIVGGLLMIVEGGVNAALLRLGQ